MARKKNHARKDGHRRHHKPAFSKKAGGRNLSHHQTDRIDKILAFLYSAGNDYISLGELIAGTSYTNRSRRELQGLIKLLDQQQLLRFRKKSFRLARPELFMKGNISIAMKGFGFVTPQQPSPELAIEGDIFIPAPHIGNSRHGDQVLMVLTGFSRGRPEGRVLQVISRGISTIIGYFQQSRQAFGLVLPEDYPCTIIIDKEPEFAVHDGEAVVVEIADGPADQRSPKGRITEVLGNPEDLAVQNSIVLKKWNLPHTFGREVLDQVNNLSDEIVPAAGREDLRDILHVTIDGEDAKDFDDAVAIAKTKNGYQLYVSIADVSHYVTIGTVVDQEAYSRGTSVYFPNMVIPMLPERLSNNLCSLVPQQDRYAFTALLDFDSQGNPTGKRFFKSIIKSHHRLTYAIVSKILIDQDQQIRQAYKEVLTPLKWMQSLAQQLESRRLDRGALGFDIPEAKILFSPDEKITAIVKAERNQAHKLIEEFMLTANEAVAAFLTEKKTGLLYRIHETPDLAKVEEFYQFSRSLGLTLKEPSVSSKWFAGVIQEVASTPKEYIVANLLLRTMKRACYSPDNCGHFGLAAPLYAHFTSPIRRYPDLMVHRALEATLKKEAARTKEKISLAEAGQSLSGCELKAVKAEREMVERLAAVFMADKVGEEYDGIIAGVTSFGLFVDLFDIFVNGGIAVKDLEDDYYEYDEKHHRLIGQRRGKMMQIGDLIRVRVINVDIIRRRINLALAQEGS